MLLGNSGTGESDLLINTLRNTGVTIVAERVRRIVTGYNDRIEAVQLESSECLDADAVVTGTRFHARADMLATLGITPLITQPD